MKLKVAIGMILISFLTGILIPFLTGCRAVDSEMSDYKGNTMYFRTISDEINGKIVYDTRTGVEYWRCDGYSNVLTVLVDVDGKPLIYDRSEEK